MRPWAWAGAGLSARMAAGEGGQSFLCEEHTVKMEGQMMFLGGSLPFLVLKIDDFVKYHFI